MFVFCLACISTICWQARRSGRGGGGGERIWISKRSSFRSRFVPPQRLEGRIGGDTHTQTPPPGAGPAPADGRERLKGCACLSCHPEWKAGSCSYTECGGKKKKKKKKLGKKKKKIRSEKHLREQRSSCRRSQTGRGFESHGPTSKSFLNCIKGYKSSPIKRRLNSCRICFYSTYVSRIHYNLN